MKRKFSGIAYVRRIDMSSIKFGEEHKRKVAEIINNAPCNKITEGPIVTAEMINKYY